MVKEDAAINKLMWHDESSITISDQEATNNRMSNVARSRDDIEKETLEKDEARTRYAGDDEEEYEFFKNNLQEKLIGSPITREMEQIDEIHGHEMRKDNKNDHVENWKSNSGAREAKEVNYNQIEKEDELERTKTLELEIRFGIEDFKNYYDKDGNEVHQSNELTKFIFDIVMLPKGKGLKFISLQSQEMQEEDEDRYTSSNNLEGDNDDDNNKELIGKITLITGNNGSKRSDLVGAYLNGVKRNILVDKEAAASITHNSD